MHLTETTFDDYSSILTTMPMARANTINDEVGKYLPQGIAVGIEANAKDVYDAMNGISKQTLDLASEGFDTSQNKSNSNNDVNYLLEIIIKLLKVIADKGDTGNDFSDRDFIRMLKSLGVVFS